MRYATQYPLPTYLMAFAVGDVRGRARPEGRRADRGVAPARGARRPRRADRRDRPRDRRLSRGALGPYPFEKYALVMLPEFSGGIEHAGITFQSRSARRSPRSRGTSRWSRTSSGTSGTATSSPSPPGTICGSRRGWPRSSAPRRCASSRIERGAGTLLGDTFWPQRGAAVRDLDLAPGEKYTSGPYSRAAWLLTQIRTLAGEDAFWGALRRDPRGAPLRRGGDRRAPRRLRAGRSARRRSRGPGRRSTPRRCPTIDVAAAGEGEAVVTLHDPEGDPARAHHDRVAPRGRDDRGGGARLRAASHLAPQGRGRFRRASIPATSTRRSTASAPTTRPPGASRRWWPAARAALGCHGVALRGPAGRARTRGHRGRRALRPSRPRLSLDSSLRLDSEAAKAAAIEAACITAAGEPDTTGEAQVDGDDHRPAPRHAALRRARLRRLLR